MEVDACLYPVTGVFSCKQNVFCLIYHDKRNPQQEIISHLRASQIIKNDTLDFFYWYYSFYIIQLQIISDYVLS